MTITCKKNLWRLTGVLIAIIVIVKDQLSKWWLMTHIFSDQYAGAVPNFITWLLSDGVRVGHAPKAVTSFFNIVLVWNRGISFGMLRNDSASMTYILSGLAVAVAIGFYIWLWREPRPLVAVCVGLIVGGALGNVWDRLRFGGVIDFLDVYIGNYHWPSFNVADASITLGVVLLIVDMIFFSSKTSLCKTSRGDALNETV